MGGIFSPPKPTPPPTPAPAPVSEADLEAKDRQARLDHIQRMRRGRAGLVSTSDTGVKATAEEGLSPFAKATSNTLILGD